MNYPFGTVILNSTSYTTVLALFKITQIYQLYKCWQCYSLPMSPSFKAGVGTPNRSTWTFNITERSGYYIVLQVLEHVVVNSDASVVGVYYNTTGP